jgi:hypothetical protein
VKHVKPWIRPKFFIADRPLRPVAVGRRNYLFAGSDKVASGRLSFMV